MGKPIISLLWTGGWDSTFRFLTLALNDNIRVQPYYIIDNERESSSIEIKTMDVIRKRVSERFEGSAERLLPTIYVNRSDIRPDESIRLKYSDLRDRRPIGTQYEWLAEFAQMYDLTGLEMCVVNPDSNIGLLISDCVMINNPLIGQYYRLPDHYDDSLPASIFKRFVFPVYSQTKQKMGDMARKNGTYDILIESWFCFSPIDGKPCGICNPCHVAITEGMEFRLPRQSINRHRFRTIFLFVRRIRSFLARKLHESTS